MSREWKPGDVAMVTGRWIRTEDHSERYAVRRPAGWMSRASVSIADYEISAIRPLVVIDPEDREQVGRLRDTLHPHLILASNLLSKWQDGLREFANPTPPQPPCGASLTLGKDGAMYRCAESEGHKGPHLDGTCTWTAKS